jgi:GNAT superfamily N-acetyltransferase
MRDIRTEHITCLPKDNRIIETRKLERNEIEEALSVVWNVFLQFEAPEYSQEGIDEFRRTLDNSERIDRMKFFGAIENNQIVGVLAMRSPQHICFFFVKADHHHKGIGKKLFNTMKKDYELQEFTVNSSPYAVEIYKHLGFIPTDKEQITNGIRYTPMKYEEAK